MAKSIAERIVLHLGDGVREVLDADDVFLLEAEGGATRVRLGERQARLDVRPLGEMAPRLAGRGFLRIHRSYAVNLTKVHMVRRRPVGRDWEVKLEPPVNRVLPVSRDAFKDLMAALEG